MIILVFFFVGKSDMIIHVCWQEKYKSLKHTYKMLILHFTFL